MSKMMQQFEIDSVIDKLETDVCSIPCLSSKHMHKLPDLKRFLNVKKLTIERSPIISLENLPPNLITLNVFDTRVQEINCIDNNLTFIPVLPSSLNVLHCGSNKLTYISDLPNNLIELSCGKCDLVYLPELPNTLEILYCYRNKLTSLPKLPNNLKSLSCYSNQITTLPELPKSLENIRCFDNRLETLPKLNNLKELCCHDNQLRDIPLIPSTLKLLRCGRNNLLFYNIDEWRTITRFRIVFSNIVLNRFLTRCFFKFIRRRKYDLHLELLFSPDLKFYMKDIETLENFKQ